MKLLNRLINDILYRILCIFLLVLFFPVLSRLMKWDYPRFIERISVRDWILFYIMILFSATYIFYRKRKAYIEKENVDRKTSFPRAALYGEENVGSLKYKDVFWYLLIPKESPLFELPRFIKKDGKLSLSVLKPSAKERLLKVRPKDIEVLGPICPKCGALFEESETFFGKYIWVCTECDFEKKNKYSYHDEWKKALLKAREEFKKYVNSGEIKNLQLNSEYLP